MESTLRIGGWTAVTLIVVLSLVPSQLRPHILAIGQMEHLIAYGLVAALLAFICRTGRHFMAICVTLPLGAAALEILQNFVPGRDPKFSDFAAGTAGAWIGIALVVVLRNLTAVDTTRLSEQPDIATQRLLSQTPNGPHDD
jgi:VanZ family protein